MCVHKNICIYMYVCVSAYIILKFGTLRTPMKETMKNYLTKKQWSAKFIQKAANILKVFLLGPLMSMKERHSMKKGERRNFCKGLNKVISFI